LQALRNANGGSIGEAGGKAGSMADIKFGDKNLLNVQLKATTPNIAEIEKIEADDGRYFNNIEEETRKFVVFYRLGNR
jgi:hypothetical protein